MQSAGGATVQGNGGAKGVVLVEAVLRDDRGEGERVLPALGDSEEGVVSAGGKPLFKLEESPANWV